MQSPYAEIHFPLPMSRGYTYRIPESLQTLAQVGCRALVPLGRRVATGFIVKHVAGTDFPEEKLRDILDVLDETPLFDETRLALAQWVAEYYLASLGEVLRTMLPPGLEKESRQTVRLRRTPSADELTELAVRAPRQAEIVQALLGKTGYKVAHLARNLKYQGVRASLRSLARQGWVELSQEVGRPAAAPLRLTYVELTAAGRRLLEEQGGEPAAVAGDTPAPPSGKGRVSEKQWQALRWLHKQGEASRPFFLKRTGLAAATLQALVKKSLVQLQRKEIDRNPYAVLPAPAAPVTLNAEQSAAVQQVVAALDQKRFGVFLLHGITGSGKTQVYIETIRHALAAGLGAIVLVPEISLTPQAVARFQANFGANIAVLHSRLSTGERYDAWRRVQRGEARVVVGARSAVFAPVPRLGLMVVDEEHDTSYKQVDPAPRYHARDVAVMRAKMAGAVVLLGSATPALESYYNARTGKYHLLQLPSRIDNVPLPAVRVIDMTRFRKTAPDHDGIFSRPLFEKIAEKIARGEQVILLQNRRGFAPMIKCVNCGFVRRCDACDIAMTYHKMGHMLRCHYCNAHERAPDTCPQCGGLDLLFKGIGTQKVEAALKTLLPQARVVRMDLDTTRGKLAHDRILHEFGEHRHDVLLGTQMIAKGLDFHKVTLVGVISADTTLLRPDFRAGERTFQLLTQVAGRAGRRNLPGEVIIQTYSPTDFCLLCAQQHDFHQFYAGEMQHRQALKYPPFSRLAVVVFRHKDETRVRGVAEDFAGLLRHSKTPMLVYGPTPAPLRRMQDEFRWQVMIKSDLVHDPGARLLRATLSRVYTFFYKAQVRRRMRVQVDIDPVALM
ncbi:MAG: primosomal protein N' [candidate division KSB1 bacterium]|nr:primosomal protein N' [candidate division KSB1 bacterium]MDZ7273607.1 primosomal protein N' [candidate division KSB1 bacterium]MDZ7286802.1 primosomal protein N' [candidate division KSB1 bacterium]MDZ7299841.1 primosomal protein N' [candidate division KSB1 bacterium]MDZ7307754.1 primosomal protein N' [candidate division KSB1 bacterium]